MDGGKIGPGRFIAVVGPSGSGKDSIIRAARNQLTGNQLAGNQFARSQLAKDRLAGEAAVVFLQRVITRPADDHEDHAPISEEGFRQAQVAGEFALSWQAHGLSYGISRNVDDAVRGGASVVVNVSRTIVPELRERYDNLVIVVVSLDPQKLRQRLAARGRETPADIDRRIARAMQEMPAGPDVVEIRNDGPLKEAVDLFTNLLMGDSA